ncbi:hypothetical protein ACQPZZ_16260 [Microbispora sp. CA-135349]|uniref:hypothetical protein n=1 Tax=Microbispora sp. CA-135349 TaxID=3239953 RepID=UPI003D8C5F98
MGTSVTADIAWSTRLTTMFARSSNRAGGRRLASIISPMVCRASGLKTTVSVDCVSDNGGR